MLPRFGRDRLRNSPVPPSNKMEAGRLYVVDAVTDKHLWLDRINYTETNGTPAYREITRDEIHRGPPFETGGPFTSIKLTRPQHTVLDSAIYRGGTYFGDPTRRWKYIGGFYDPLWILTDPVSEAVYNSLGYSVSALFPDLATIGSAAYTKLRPRPEGVGLGVALAEAKDMPRMLKTSAEAFHQSWQSIRRPYALKQSVSKQMEPKSAANHFLNHHFGWVPFINDMLDLDSTYQNASALKAKIKRNNGNWVRRKRSDKILESETLVYSRTDIPGCQPRGYPYDTIYKPAPYSFTIHLQEITEVWYEGKFKSYLPEFDDSVPWSHTMHGAIMRDLTLYGAKISPTVVWKATPWSWLIDWFSNVQEGITRMEDWASDGVVSKYMYLMHHRQRFYKFQSKFETTDGNMHTLVWYRKADIKRREAANANWGFALSGDLNAKQIAILAALGLSRGSGGSIAH